MTIYVHFRERNRQPIKVHNVASVHDLGDSTIRVVNAFGGEPQTFADVRNVAAEPERGE